jgi:hypothetical protein
VLDRIGLGRLLAFWIGSALLGVSISAAWSYACSFGVSLCKQQASALMDGRTSCLERAPVVTSGDNSPTSAAHAGLPLPIAKRCASVDGTCEAAQGCNGLLEAQICYEFLQVDHFVGEERPPEVCDLPSPIW